MTELEVSPIQKGEVSSKTIKETNHNYFLKQNSAEVCNSAEKIIEN